MCAMPVAVPVNHYHEISDEWLAKFLTIVVPFSEDALIPLNIDPATWFNVAPYNIRGLEYRITSFIEAFLSGRVVPLSDDLDEPLRCRITVNPNGYGLEYLEAEPFQQYRYQSNAVPSEADSIPTVPPDSNVPTLSNGFSSTTSNCSVTFSSGHQKPRLSDHMPVFHREHLRQSRVPRSMRRRKEMRKQRKRKRQWRPVLSHIGMDCIKRNSGAGEMEHHQDPLLENPRLTVVVQNDHYEVSEH